MRHHLKWFIKNIVRASLKPIVKLFYNPSPTIIVKLQAGLGNQMFQYALGRALELRTRREVLFDRSWFENSFKRSNARTFELDIFSLPISYSSKKEIPFDLRPARSWYGSFWNILLQRIWFICGLPTRDVIFDCLHEFKSDILEINANQNVFLNGYWQSDKYFKDVEDVIRNDFTFRIEPDKENQVILDKLAADTANGIETVSIHIRRGDYSSDPQIVASHGTLPLNYYQSAMSEIEKRFPKVLYYGFSDDLSWCRINLKFKGEFIFVNVNENKPGWMDMRLMSSCRHHIIANSSFSWWAAWLNPNHDKVVIAPQKWLLNEKLSNKDMVPGNWIKIASPKGEAIFTV